MLLVQKNQTTCQEANGLVPKDGVDAMIDVNTTDVDISVQ